MPITQPPPTATPEPPPTSTPTPTPGPEAYFPAQDPERPEIIGLQYRGYAGEEDSAFIVVFDEPVFVVQDSGSDPKVELEVQYSGGDSARLELRTQTSLRNPSRTLEFGPLAEEYARVNNGVRVSDAKILSGVNQEPAILGSVALSRHPDAIFLNPDYADDVEDPKLVRCAALAEIDRVSPIVVRSIKSAVIDTLTDAHRSDWLGTLRNKLKQTIRSREGSYSFGELYRMGRFDLLQSHPCSLLWSVDVSHKNAQKRNDWALEGCMPNSFDVIGHYGPEHTADLVELLTRPYLNLDTSDRAVLRLMLGSSGEPYGIENAENRKAFCHTYYPQLYSGVWVPIQAPE